MSRATGILWHRLLRRTLVLWKEDEQGSKCITSKEIVFNKGKFKE